MKQVKIGELYQELVIGLNGLIEKTIEIQEATGRNSVDYREALKFQIELEKTKLNIMETVGESFHHKITDKGLTGYDELGRPIFEIKDTGDARFVGKVLAKEYNEDEKSKEDIKESNIFNVEVTINGNSHSASDLVDSLLKNVKKVGR